MSEERIDLGGIVVSPRSGIDIQVQADQETGVVSQVTFAGPQGAVQVQPFAAPRSGGMWEEIRSQIVSSVAAQGGLAEVAEGRFGSEILAQLPSSGGGAMQPLRFCALEGPRWLLRAVFLGGAARDADIAEPLEAMVREISVVRGDVAMPVGAPIPLRLPSAPSAPAVDIPESPAS
jgi:hypothetical protein